MIAVGRRMAGNERAEAALWCLMKLIRANTGERAELLAAFMGDSVEEE
jgi:hypothetical protein